MPEISVILPVYNSELFIKDAIQSILNQTFSDFELLIYNDGSTDKTHEIINSFDDERIIYKKIEKNAGHLHLLNEGLLLARGKYIARMDADDIALPNRFQKQFDYLENNPEVGICGTWVEFFGKKTGIGKTPASFEEVIYAMFFCSPIAHPTIMMRNSLIKKHNLKYESEYNYAEDYNLFVDSSFHFKIVNIPIVLLKYRYHHAQISNSKWKEQFSVTSKIQTKLFLKAITSFRGDEFDWLYNFFFEKSMPSDQWLAEVNNYKRRIIDGNNQKHVFPHSILVRATDKLFNSKIKSNFYQYYFQKYYNQKKYGLRLLQAFYKEKYKPYRYFGKKLTFYFILKCLGGYKNSNILQS